MGRKITLVCVTLFITCILFTSHIPIGRAHDTGPPAACSGSPSDGATCSQTNCHDSHTVTPVSYWISSNIPSSGYLADSTYTITAKAVDAGNTYFGFEISPQNLSGTLLGTLINTNDSTQIVSTKWIGHTIHGINGKDSDHWHFNWKAPKLGTGSVTFYGAFNCNTGTASAAGSYVFTSTLTISENKADGINAIESGNNALYSYPNPTTGLIHIGYNLSQSREITLTLYSMEGKAIKVLANNSSQSAGQHIQEYNLAGMSKGVYFIKCESEGQSTVQRIILE